MTATGDFTTTPIDPEDLINSAESTLALARLRWIRRTADQVTEPF